MDFINIFKEIIVLFLVIGVGYLSGKLGVISRESSDQMSNLMMKVTFPSLIISSMLQTFSKELLVNSIGILIISICVHLLFIFIAYLWAKWVKMPYEQMAVLQFIIIFGNTTFMGYPVINAVYGKLGLFYATSFNLVTILLIFSYGIILLSKKGSGNILKKLANPGFIAVIIGYILFFAQIELPYVIVKTLQWVGDITIPLALLIIGNSLVNISVKDLFNDKQLWYISLERLLVVPVIILIILKLLELNIYMIGISVIMSATPAALLAGVFARTYGCDGNIGDRSVVLTHILSIITIPLIIYFLGL